MLFNSAACLSNLSGRTPTQVDTLTQNSKKESDEPQKLQESEGGAQDDGQVVPGQVRTQVLEGSMYQ